MEFVFCLFVVSYSFPRFYIFFNFSFILGSPLKCVKSRFDCNPTSNSDTERLRLKNRALIENMSNARQEDSRTILSAVL
jgi:hypothetical protein